MPISKKTVQKQNLAQYRTWITDTDPTSRYFRLTQLADTLTIGKNAFLVNGSLELAPNSEVLIELIDSAGNTVFCHPVKRYLEGLARLVSIEVYSDTPEGLATLTILGKAARDVDGNLPPDEFLNAYNVKWQRTIPIAPTKGNITPIRLYHYPTASVGEVLNPFRLTAQTITTNTGSAGTAIQGIALQSSVNLNDPVANPFVIVANTGSFVKEMEGGQFRAVVPGYGAFTASITTVANNQMAQLDAGPILSGSYLSFLTSTFSLLYSGSPQYTASEYIKSYANLHWKNLSTFSGDIYKIKVYMDSPEAPSDPRPITEVIVDAPELLVTASLSIGQPTIQLGNVTTDTIAQNYWTAGLMTSQSLYNPG